MDEQERKPRGTGRRLRGAVANYLGTAIVSGEIAPGDRLSGEVANAEALDVSRSAYREAVQVLTAKGLVESRPKAGTRVLPRSRWNLLDPDVLAWTFEGEPDPDFIQDLFELRGVIEPAACAFAARRRSLEDLAAMKAALDVMEASGLGTPAGRAADQRFHRAILSAADNEPLTALASTVGAAVRWTTEFKQRRRALPRNPLPDHVRVYEAIAARDAATAHAVMSDLLRLALQDMDLRPRG